MELTTVFRNISTSGGRDAKTAVAKAQAHLRYISRASAVEDTAHANLTSSAPATDLLKRFSERSREGGKNGARIAEKIIVSLPNSWPREARREALQRLCDHIAPPGSEAVAYGVTHKDKAHNQHLHILAQDGAESREAALLRKGRSSGQAATRLRRRNAIRLSDKNRAKELRAEIAGILNEVARLYGVGSVEHRSYRDRGIDVEPMQHEGPRVRAIAAKTGKDPSGRMMANQERWAKFFNSTAIYSPIDELFSDMAPPLSNAKTSPTTPAQDRQVFLANTGKRAAMQAHLKALEQVKSRQKAKEAKGRGFSR